MGKSVHIRIEIGFGKDGKTPIKSDTTASSGKGPAADETLERVFGELVNNALIGDAKPAEVRLSNADHDRTLAGRKADKEGDGLSAEVDPIVEELEVDPIDLQLGGDVEGDL